MSPPPDRSSRQLEEEFGVPIPGTILPAERWTQTALKKFPQTGDLDWQTLFGRSAPIVLDIGCGNGRFSLGSALWRPGHDHLATDILPVVIRYATRRGNQRGLKNLRFGVIGGLELLRDKVPPHSVTEIHCYHPQPYYQPAEIHKRLITPEFLALAHRSLVTGGLLILQTDNPGYWKYMQQVVPCFFDFQQHTSVWPDAPQGRTRREIIALKRGLPVFRGIGRARHDVDALQSRQLAESLPVPTFDADRRLQALDDLERHGH